MLVSRHNVFWLPTIVTAACSAFGSPAPGSASFDLAIVRDSNRLVVSWSGPGRLQWADRVEGSWREVLGATTPFVVPTTEFRGYFQALSRYDMRAALLEANSEMGVAELNGNIYVMGGYPSNRETVRTVQVYDSTLDRWQLTTPLPLPVNHPMPATVLGRLYLIGGQTNASSTTSFINTVFEFNPDTTQWTARAPMPTARSSGAAAVVGHLIYVAGGRPPRGQDFAVYDALVNTWTNLPPMPTGRNHLAAASIGGKIYVAGGRLGGGFNSEMVNTLEVFDPDTGQWSTLASMPTTRGGVNGIAVHDRFFVFGGEGPDGVFENMEMYDPGEDQWHELEPLPVPVHGVTGSAYLGGYLHLPGGGTSEGGTSGSTFHQVFWVEGLVVDEPASPTLGK